MISNTTETILDPPDTIRPRQKRWGQLAVWVLFVALMAVMGWKLVQVTRGSVSSGSAPDFTLITFDGESFTLSDYRGHVVVINFWASWCGPCALEAATLEQAWRDHRDLGVVFLGVDYVDTESEALVYLENWGISYPNGPDMRTEISLAYRIRGVPETYIVDRNGNVAAHIIGIADHAKLTSTIASLLSE